MTFRLRIASWVTVAAAAALAIAAPAGAQRTPDEYADGWAEQKRGERPIGETVVDEATTRIADRLFGSVAEGTMSEILAAVLDDIERRRNATTNTPCPAAALEQAFAHAVDIRNQQVLSQAGGMLLSALQGAAGGGDWRSFLGKRLARQVGEVLRDQALDEFRDQLRARMRQASPELFEDAYDAGPCRGELRIVWNKAREEYSFLFAGTCECNLVTCGGTRNWRVPLARWVIEGKGTVIPDVTQLANGEKRVSYRIARPTSFSLTADCCRGEGERRFVTLPDNGAGNEWVGFIRLSEPSAPPRPRTGGERPTEAPPSVPAPDEEPQRVPVPVPAVPDRPLSPAELDDLGQRASRALGHARERRDAAQRDLEDLEDGGASADDIARARERVAEADSEVRRAEAALDELNRRLEMRSQSAVPAPRLDPVAAAILGEHNRVRAQVGVPPLRWNAELAAGAAAYGPLLSRGQRLQHSSREGRRMIRENLLQALRGVYSPVQMVRVWSDEQRLFRPGIFPNVSSDGNWASVGHYTQMIWPTTTDVGCAIHRDQRNDWLICRYSPPGNADGKRVP